MTARVVVFAGVKGAGGVTGSALAFAAGAALECEGSVTLVEADPSGGSLLGWCSQLEPGPGLYEAVFDRGSGLGGVSQRLGDVRVVVTQGGPFRIAAALGRPRGWRGVLDAPGGVVVVDVGRLYAGSPAAELVGVADRVVLVAPAEPGPLAASLEWVSVGGRWSAGDGIVDARRVRLVTVDVAPAHRPGRVDPGLLSRRDLGEGYVAHLPFDPVALGALCRGASLTHRSVRRSSLASAVRGLWSAVDGERLGVWC